jgi:P-type Mg2+ transporter
MPIYHSFMNYLPSPFWSIPTANLLEELQTTSQGLTKEEAKQRLMHYGVNLLKPKRKSDTLTLLLAQFQSPIVLILIFAAGLSFFVHDHIDGLIILGIVGVSGLLGFWQERGAANAVEKLLAIVQAKVSVRRDSDRQTIPVEEIVLGDITILNAGGTIPGDCLILKSKDLFVDEAVLTGETYPVAKMAGILPIETPLSQRTNVLFMGTHVVSGTAEAVVVRTGKYTEFGQVSERLKLRAPETDFEQGIRRFGYFLMEVTLILVIAIFAINVYLARPILDAFLFSLALAVGLTPQLLPAVISVNLAHGARRMARQSVIVKRLAAIENFGSMNVLCSDKTGTLTEGAMQIHSALNVNGNENQEVLFYAYLNAFYETGYVNPIDEAIRSHCQFDLSGYQKLDESPYDFIRKRLSVLVAKNNTHLLVTKGALKNVLEVCSSVQCPNGAIADITPLLESIQQRYEEFSRQGFRTLGIACRDLGSTTNITKALEAEMTFLGFLLFADPPKTGITGTIYHLENLGISLKIITGDNQRVATKIAQQIGMTNFDILTGSDLHQTSDAALLKRVNEVNIFAEVEPNQKERIILALKKAGNVVGYLGDGINDASAIHVADVGISVNSAVDVAKEAADIVLLEKDLGVLVQGVQEGRTTFANTLKYVFMATSANFGNMFSMAGVSLFLPFLPLLPKQILLTNLLTDFPEMTIATDSVDRDMISKPRRWNIQFIRNFMLVFGLISSVFDYLTFGTLWFIVHATPEQFRTGWFIESVISAAAIVLVIRTRKPFFKSQPSKYLLTTTLAIVAITSILPYVPVAGLLDLQPLPASFLSLLGVIVAIYMVTADQMKQIFYQYTKF